MADTPDSKQATPEDATVSADGAVELTETQLENAEGGALLLPGSIAMEGGFKLTTDMHKLDVVASKISPTAFKY